MLTNALIGQKRNSPLLTVQEYSNLKLIHFTLGGYTPVS